MSSVSHMRTFSVGIGMPPVADPSAIEEIRDVFRLEDVAPTLSVKS